MTGGRVVVLGRTGRNFAAGMSGGIAYVLDDDRAFAPALQHGDGRSRASRRRAKTADCVRDLIARHARSPAARSRRRVLDDWAAMRQPFVDGDAARLQARAQAARGDGARRGTAARLQRSGGSVSMGKATGFIEFARSKPPARPVAERVHD